MTESQLLRQVMDWLAAEHVFALRMNTGAVKIEQRFVKFGIPGMADILAFPDCNGDIWGEGKTPTWIELKVGKNGQSELQKSFQARVEREHHKYIVCYSLECVEAHFR